MIFSKPGRMIKILRIKLIGFERKMACKKVYNKEDQPHISINRCTPQLVYHTGLVYHWFYNMRQIWPALFCSKSITF